MGGRTPISLFGGCEVNTKTPTESSIGAAFACPSPVPGRILLLPLGGHARRPSLRGPAIRGKTASLAENAIGSKMLRSLCTCLKRVMWGLFVSQIQLQVSREIVGVGETPKTEFVWVRTELREPTTAARPGRLVAEMTLQVAVPSELGPALLFSLGLVVVLLDGLFVGSLRYRP